MQPCSWMLWRKGDRAPTTKVGPLSHVPPQSFLPMSLQQVEKRATASSDWCRGWVTSLESVSRGSGSLLSPSLEWATFPGTHTGSVLSFICSLRSPKVITSWEARDIVSGDATDVDKHWVYFHEGLSHDQSAKEKPTHNEDPFNYYRQWVLHDTYRAPS